LLKRTVPTNESFSGTSAQLLERPAPTMFAPSETVRRPIGSWVSMSSTPESTPPYFDEKPPLEKKALFSM